MGLSDQYKRRAAECVRMAERTDHADDKALLLQMAQTWLRLAEKAEERADRDRNSRLAIEAFWREGGA